MPVSLIDYTAVQPVSDYILIRVAVPEETKGGISLPDSAKRPEQIGEVVAVGPGVVYHGAEKPTRAGCFVQVGDTAIFHVAAAEKVSPDGFEKVGGFRYLFVKEANVLGVVRRAPG